MKRLKLTREQKQKRVFSESFKRKKVFEPESGQTRPIDVSRGYDVSLSSIYKWLNKYGMKNKDKPERIIVESKSDTKQLLELRKRVAELERMVGQKQIQLDFKEKMIELAEEHYKVDIKKKFTEKRSTTIGRTGKNSK